MCSWSKAYYIHGLNASTGDEDVDRRTQAEVLLNAYSRDLERKRLAAGAAGIFLHREGEFSTDTVCKRIISVDLCGDFSR